MTDNLRALAVDAANTEADAALAGGPYPASPQDIANAVLEALEDAGYVPIRKAELADMRGMADALAEHLTREIEGPLTGSFDAVVGVAEQLESPRPEYVRHLEDAVLVLWHELHTDQVRLLREETPRLMEFCKHLHRSIEHEQAMVRVNVWGEDGPQQTPRPGGCGQQAGGCECWECWAWRTAKEANR